MLRSLLTLTLLLFASTIARAHDFGALRVSALIDPSGAFTLDLTLFPEHVPVGLRPPSDPAALAPYWQKFAASAHVTSSGTEIPTDVTLLASDPARGDLAPQVRLKGSFPAGTTSWTFEHPSVRGQYLIEIGAPGSIETLGVWADGGRRSPDLPLTAEGASRSTLDTLITYAGLGFTHIIPEGLDHILFVLGLFLLSVKWKPLLSQVTAFTVAHSLTLALSIYGVVTLPSSIVEPLIALSIVYVAIENIWCREYRHSRLVVVFLFGLLHGLGFAGVLTELGLPRDQFVPALISFNVGVELGQLTVIAAAFLAVGAWCSRREWYRPRVVIPASLAIAGVGAFWTVERLIG